MTASPIWKESACVSVVTDNLVVVVHTLIRRRPLSPPDEDFVWWSTSMLIRHSSHVSNYPSLTKKKVTPSSILTAFIIGRLVLVLPLSTT